MTGKDVPGGVAVVGERACAASAILLVAGDKAGNWNAWYRRAIPHAEELYAIYLKERADEE
jgi:hypothetical protein